MSDLENYLSKDKEKKLPARKKKEVKAPKIVERRKKSLLLEELSKDELLRLLNPLMARVPGFVSNIAWTRQKILPQNPNIQPDELAKQLQIPLLEAYVILTQLKSDSV
jgi:hypothetical protein